MKFSMRHGFAVTLLIGAFILAACGSSGSSTGTSSGSSTSAEAGAKDPVTFALVTPLSEPGDYRSGELIQKVGELWTKQTNAAGGVDGHKVNLKVYDDQGKPAVGASDVERAITQDKASGIFGVWHSSVTVAQMNVVHRYNVPLFAFYSWADQVTGDNLPQVFRIGPYNSQIAANFAPFIKQQGYKKVAVLAEDTDYGIGFAEALKKAVGTEATIDVTQFPAQSEDVTAQLSKIKTQNPDAVIIATVYAASNLAVRQAKEVGLDAQLIAGWDYPTSADFWKTVGKAGVDIIYPTFYDKSLALTPTGQDFAKAYEAAYGSNPVIMQYFLWDTLNAQKTAIEKAKSTDPAELVKTLPSIEFEGTTGKITFANEKGTPAFNQWMGVKQFFMQLTAEGQSGEDATLLFPKQ
ncbi:MAG: ABC transporter substrate-binding protein [Solirubrobacteraceae bacterium]